MSGAVCEQAAKTIQIQREDFDLAKIAASGQCFRLNRTGEGRWSLIALGRRLVLEERADGAELFCSVSEYEALWHGYFDLDTRYRIFRAAVPAEDRYLTDAVRFGRGIRILRQDPWEMLVTFLISQRKNIPAIRKAVETLCALCGEALEGGGFAFPGPERVAALSERELGCCALGYRTGYVRGAAELVSSGALDLTALASEPDEELRRRLMAVPGVGVKVANCVMLFGYHRLTGFPVDVWIDRTLREQYPDGLALDRYAGFEGVIQQYLFYYARSGGALGGGSASGHEKIR